MAKVVTLSSESSMIKAAGAGQRLPTRGKELRPKTSRRCSSHTIQLKRRVPALGLAIVRKVIEDHGGTVSVHSKLGGGNTIYNYFASEREQREERMNG